VDELQKSVRTIDKLEGKGTSGSRKTSSSAKRSTATRKRSTGS